MIRVDVDSILRDVVRVGSGHQRARLAGAIIDALRWDLMTPADSLVRAADLLAAGDWEAAHLIVQEDSSPLAAWMHGIVHLLEGDVSNARYWYGQASRPFPASTDVPREIEAVAAAARARTPSA
jgi:hypothetical protein